MRYTVTKQRVDVLGDIWQPGAGVCAMSRDLAPHELVAIGDLSDHQVLAHHVARLFGDFRRIRDFRADFTVGDRSIVHDWQSEESESTFYSCMFGDDE